MAHALLPLDARAQQRPGALSGEQLREQAAMVTEFRKARGAQAARLEIIDRAAAHSRHTLRKVHEVLLKEMNRPFAEYRQQFTAAASEMIRRRAVTDNLQEVSELRSRVLNLTKNEALTKEMIVATSDPALERLKEIFLVKPADVLAAHPELNKKREALEDSGRLWERSATRMLESDEKNGKDDKDGKKSDAANQPRDKLARNADEAASDSGEPPQPPSFAEYLAKEEEIAVALAAPMSPATRAVLAVNLQLASKVEPEEVRCVLDLNLTRNLLGLSPLRIDLTLVAVARDHSADMERLNFFSHDSPIPGKKTPWDRAERAGTSASGENIAVGTIDGAVANRMWWHSPGHHKNMLGDHARVGIGCTGKYWTELFGK